MNLQEAIELAKEAHKGYWRRSKNLDTETTKLFFEMGEEIYPTVLGNGNKIFIKDDGFVMKEPYITHPLAVMNMMDTEEEKIIAVLHDVVEDCEGYQLFQKGSRYFLKTLSNNILIKPNIYYALQCLTRVKGEAYLDYIKDISDNRLATKIKLADMFHNMSDNPSERAKEKYLKALPILLKGLS